MGAALRVWRVDWSSLSSAFVAAILVLVTENLRNDIKLSPDKGDIEHTLNLQIHSLQIFRAREIFWVLILVHYFEAITSSGCRRMPEWYDTLPASQKLFPQFPPSRGAPSVTSQHWLPI